MASVLELLAKITLNKTQFDAQLDSASKVADKFGRNVTKKIGQAFAVTAIINFTREVIETGKEIDKLADKIGTTAESAQRIRLREMLGGDIGKGQLLMSDRDLENLRVADRLYIKIRESVKAVAARAAFTIAGANNPIASVIQGGIALAKKTGIVPSDAPTLQQEERARQAHMATQDRILQLEKEAAELNARTVDERLTDEERLNRSLKKRLELQAALKAVGVLSEEGEAILKKKLAEVELSIVQQQKARTGMRAESGGVPGVFVGAAANANAVRAQAITNTLLKDILKMTKQGITVKDVR